MIIKELGLKGFKRFRDNKVALGPGFTVLAGDNEAGKSTLLEALLAVLYASPKSRARTVDEWISWGSEERPGLSLLYEVDGIEFRLEKDFEAGTVSLTNTATGESLADEKKVNNTVAEQIGIGDRDLFLATACVRHDELGEISSGAAEIKDRLQEVMTGSREDVSAQGVLKALNDKIAEINRGMERPATKPGVRRALADSVAGLTQRSREKRQEAERHWGAVESLARINQEIDRIRAEHQSRKSLLEKNRRFMAGRDRLDALSKEFREVESRLGRIREIEEDRARAASRNSNLSAFATAPDALAELARIDGAIEEFRQAEELEKARMADAPRQRRGAGRIIMGVVGLALFATGVYLGYEKDPYLYLVAAAGAALAGYSVAGLSSGAGDEIQSLVRMRAEEMRSRAEAAEVERRSILERYHAASLTELQEGYRLYQEAASGHDRFDGEIEGLLAGKTREALLGERTELARGMATEEQALEEGLRQAALTPQEFHELGEQVDRMEKQLASLSEARLQERLVMESTSGAAEEALLLEESLEATSRELAGVERRLSVYEKTASAMEEAIRSTFSSSREMLERELAGHMASITGGRYDWVSVAEADLSLALYSTEKGGQIPVTQLSKGTVDQLYLSARLSLVNVLFGEKKPPVILDDPLHSFDDNRMAGAMAVLEEFAADHQLILFTCHDRYSRFGGRTVRL